ncbi:MAG: C1 family peptidase [Candidatus Hodarchaeota archaeon]|jgi:hypothetical protein
MESNYFKKASMFGIIFLLLGSGFVSGYTEISSSSKCNFQPKNSEKIDYFFDEEYPTMPPIPINPSSRVPNSFNINLVNTPEKFNWKNIDGKDWTTPVRNQGNCGSCWLFSAMGALESVINIKEGCAELDPDLSEQYILSCLPAAGSCNGGNVEKCVFYFINITSSAGNYRNGVILESCLGYYADDDIPCNDKCENWEDLLVPISDYGESWTYYNIPELRDTIKSLVYQKGPIMVYFWASKRFINWGKFHRLPSQYYPDYNENCPNFVNHGITIVGWKDDPSIGNGGYWICKNTWGPNWGYNGFFNIEYDCLNLGGFIAWVDYDPESFNWGPTAPAINGPTSGAPGEEYEFKFTSMDPDGDDDIYYYIEWGDGLLEEWIGPYESGESVEIKHIWENKSNYNIRVKAKDIMGRESNWATLKLTMPRNRIATYNSLFLRLLEQFPILQILL